MLTSDKLFLADIRKQMRLDVEGHSCLEALNLGCDNQLWVQGELSPLLMISP